MRIMIVDDYAPFVAVITHFLRRHAGIEVVGQAFDSLNGLRLVDELRPDLVLVDYDMPMMDGITFTRLLKSRPNPPKVVMMSFVADAYIQEDALATGVDAFIEKDGIHSQLVPLLEHTLQSEDDDGRSSTEPGRGLRLRTGRHFS